MTITIYLLRIYEATGFKHICKSKIRATFCMCPSQCLVVRGKDVGNDRFCISRFTPCWMWWFFNWQIASFGRRILTASGKNGGRNKILFGNITKQTEVTKFCCHSGLTFCLSTFLTKNIFEYTQKYNYFSFFVWVWNLVAVIEGEELAVVVWE